MSQLNVGSISSEQGNGSPTFPNGIAVTGPVSGIVNLATQLQAELGIDNVSAMTPLRVEQHFNKKVTISTVDPTILDGTDGDIWFKVE